MKSIMTALTPTLLTVFITISLLAFISVEVDGKRGCSAFGHSCYGGHGKKSFPETSEYEMMKRKEENQMDYNTDTSQEYNGSILRKINSILERSTSSPWSLFIKKLLVPLTRSYTASSEIQQ